MFFSSSTQGLIMEANLDGSGLHTIDTGLSDPVGMGVDPVAQKVYWTGGTSTQSANFDGSNVQTVLNLGGRDVIVNPTTGKLYIGGTSGIYSANLDGSDSQLLLRSPTEFSQMGIDFTTGKIYWSALNPGTIYEANLDGSDQQTLIPGLGLPRDIAIVDSVATPEPPFFVLLLSGGLVVALACNKGRPAAN